MQAQRSDLLAHGILQLAPADQQQVQWRVAAHLREGFNQQRVVFGRGEASDMHQHGRVRLDAVRLSPLGAGVGVGRVLVGRYAVGDEPRVGVAVQLLNACPHLVRHRHRNHPADWKTT